MSRYIVSHPDHDVVVGWDNPLETFFAQILKRDAAEDEDELIDGIGMQVAEVTDPDTLDAFLGRYGVRLDTGPRQKLSSDLAAATPPSPPQRMFRC